MSISTEAFGERVSVPFIHGTQYYADSVVAVWLSVPSGTARN